MRASKGLQRIGRLRLTVLGGTALALSACNGGGSSDDTTAGSGGAGGSGGTGAGGTGGSSALPAPFAKFKTADTTCGSNVDVYVDGGDIVIEANALPNHGSPYFAMTNSCHEVNNEPGFQQNPNQIAAQTLVFRIPASPVEAANKQATPLGPIGVSLNGVPFFNQYAGPNQPLTSEIVSFDQYSGHPQQQGGYHYHVEPVYLTASDGSDALLGFLLDGYPVYGPAENGAAVTNAALDAYHGHFGVTADYPNGTYHYHVTDADPYINGNGFFGEPGSVSQ